MSQRIKYGLMVLGLVIALRASGQGANAVDAAAYDAGQLVIKFATSATDPASLRDEPFWPQADALLKQAGMTQMRQLFPLPPNREESAKWADRNLARIYQLTLSESVAKALETIGLPAWLEYAEPLYQHQAFLMPNDSLPGYSIGFLRDNMFGHRNSQIYEAWDSTQGDTAMVIGIIDTGGMPTHPSLDETLHYNWAERNGLPGVDDDGNGFVDDVLGWDFADQDADVTDFWSDHGVSVCGSAAATVNDTFGTYGSAYHCQYLPIKIENTRSGTTGSLSGNYEAIVYAARNGCKVINLSWGRTGTPVQYEQDVIRSVVAGYDVLLVAAAGNTAAELDFMPASYQHVVSVGHTGADDSLDPTGTFSHFMDMTAAGNRVLSTRSNMSIAAGHNFVRGSSFAAPLVAGVAGLVWVKYPELRSEQVGALLRATTDDTYGISANSGFGEMLGSGRLNALRAIQERHTALELRAVEFDWAGPNGQQAAPGDTVSVTARWVNYLNQLPASFEIPFAITSETEHIQLVDSVFIISQSLGELDTISNADQPFRFVIKPSAPQDLTLKARFGYDYPSRSDYQYHLIHTDSAFLNFAFNDFALSFGANGRIGYLGKQPGTMGLGIFHEGVQAARHAGLMLMGHTQGEDRLASSAWQSAIAHQDDFVPSFLPRYNTAIDTSLVSLISGFRTRTSTGLPIEVSQVIGGRNTAGHQDYILVEYRMTNKGGEALDTLRAALFADWLLADTLNFAQWDTTRQLGYVYRSGGKYLGVQVLNHSPIYHAVDYYRESAGIRAGNGFSPDEKMAALRQGISNPAAGQAAGGNRVAHLTGATLGGLAPGQTRTLLLAIHGAGNLSALQTSADSALAAYANKYRPSPPTLADTTFFAAADLSISPKGGSHYRFYASAALDSVIGEGSEMPLTPSDTARYFYATRLDGIMESLPDSGRVFLRDTINVWDGVGWSLGRIPNANDHARIDGEYVVENEGDLLTGDLTINQRGRLRMSSGSIRLHGHWRNEGQFEQEGGQVICEGSNAQSFSGTTTFRELRLNNAAGFAIGQATDLIISRWLQLDAGTLETQPGSRLILDATATQTAEVHHNGGSVSGDHVVARQYLQRHHPGIAYRHLSSPVSGVSYADLSGPGFALNLRLRDLFNANPNAAGLGADFPNLFYYDAAIAQSNLAEGWRCPEPDAMLPQARGLAVRMDRSDRVGHTPVAWMGALQDGLIQIGLTNPGTNPATNRLGWHLLGNPYAAALDAAQLMADNAAAIDGAMYLFASSSTFGGSYAVRTQSGIATDGFPDYLAPMQAFFVRCPLAAATFDFRNSQRADSYQGSDFLRTAAGQVDPAYQGILRLELRRADLDLATNAVLTFHPETTWEFDPGHEAHQLQLPDVEQPALYFYQGTDSLLVKSLPASSQSHEEALALFIPQPATYLFSLIGLDRFPPHAQIRLHDALTGQRWPLDTVGSVALTLPAGHYANRFYLQLADIAHTPAGLMPDARPPFQLSSQGQQLIIRFADLEAAKAQVAITDIAGRTLHTTDNRHQPRQTLRIALPGQRLVMVRIRHRDGVHQAKCQIWGE